MTTRRELLLGAAATVILGRMPGAPTVPRLTFSPRVIPPGYERVTATIRGLDAFGKPMLETISVLRRLGPPA